MVDITAAKPDLPCSLWMRESHRLKLDRKRKIEMVGGERERYGGGLREVFRSTNW